MRRSCCSRRWGSSRLGQPFALDQGLLEAVAATLRDAARDPAFAAEALLLPGESLLADAMDVVDPDAIRAVREAIRKALGLALQAEFAAAYAAFGETDAADVSGPAIARRAMKNTALGYLCAAGDTSARRRAVQVQRQHDRPSGRTRQSGGGGG